MPPADALEMRALAEFGAPADGRRSAAVLPVSVQARQLAGMQPAAGDEHGTGVDISGNP